jgi:hypothetical protein
MLERRTVITLTSDFGTKDPFVGQMKGVIININPNVELVDITHEITPHNIKEAALSTGFSYKYFPPRTIHLVVVDPGVGSSRRPILVVTEDHYFIGPDNGVFSLIYQKEKRYLKVFHITADHYFLKKGSPTFQGRDLFAPVAAWLAKGIPAANFGEEISDYNTIFIPEPKVPTKNALEGEVIYIDRFGNAITNISLEAIEQLRATGNALRIVYKGKEIPLKTHYSEAEDKGLKCLINSFDLLELFVYRGSAAREYEINIGDVIGIIARQG